MPKKKKKKGSGSGSGSGSRDKYLLLTRSIESFVSECGKESLSGGAEQGQVFEPSAIYLAEIDALAKDRSVWQDHLPDIEELLTGCALGFEQLSGEAGVFKMHGGYKKAMSQLYVCEFKEVFKAILGRSGDDLGDKSDANNSICWHILETAIDCRDTEGFKSCVNHQCFLSNKIELTKLVLIKGSECYVSFLFDEGYLEINEENYNYFYRALEYYLKIRVGFCFSVDNHLISMIYQYEKTSPDGGACKRLRKSLCELGVISHCCFLDGLYAKPRDCWWDPNAVLDGLAKNTHGASIFEYIAKRNFWSDPVEGMLTLSYCQMPDEKNDFKKSPALLTAIRAHNTPLFWMIHEFYPELIVSKDYCHERLSAGAEPEILRGCTFFSCMMMENNWRGLQDLFSDHRLIGLIVADFLLIKRFLITETVKTLVF